MKHRRLLPPQLLETRTMHAVWGNPWPNPQTLQFSFAADGSPIESQVSALFQKLDSQMPRQEWQYKSLLALQSWSQHAQLNFSVVDDSGIRFGVNSAQGSAGVGDIRLGAAALTHREIAVAAPFDLATDWSGDVLLNSQYSFDSATGFDLYTVLLQEFGHALSLPPSEQNDSVLYGKYLGVRSGLSDVDIVAIQSLYGERQDDRFDRAQRNDTFGTASNLTFVNDVDQFIGIDPRVGSAPFIAAADITTLEDRDLYRFEIPIDVNSFEAIVRGHGISMLHARVSIYDSTGIKLYENRSLDPWNNDVRITLSLDACYRELFLEVAPSVENAFGVGSYEISVGKEAQEALYPNPTPFFADDIGDDDDGTDTTIVLDAKTNGPDVLWEYTTRASLSFVEDRDIYRIDPPTTSDGGTRLVIGLWSLSGDNFSPDLELAYDELFGTRLIVETIRNEPGTYVVQLSEPLQARPIYVRVDRQQTGTGSDVGNYFLAADYRSTGLSFTPLATGWVDEEFPQQLFTLRVENTQLHLLRLTFLGGGIDSSDVATRVTIYDSARNPVTSFVGRPGTVVTETVLLPADVYTVRVFGGTRSGSLLPRLDFEISGLIVSDPIGPVPVSPVRRRDWSRQCLAGCYSDRGRYVTWLSSVDPFANPFR